jgi:hypothetical protein
VFKTGQRILETDIVAAVLQRLQQDALYFIITTGLPLSIWKNQRLALPCEACGILQANRWVIIDCTLIANAGFCEFLATRAFINTSMLTGG